MGTQLSDGAAPESAVKKLINIESSERSGRIRELSSAVTHRDMLEKKELVWYNESVKFRKQRVSLVLEDFL